MSAIVPQEFGQAELSRQCRWRNDSPNALCNAFRKSSHLLFYGSAAPPTHHKKVETRLYMLKIVDDPNYVFVIQEISHFGVTLPYLRRMGSEGWFSPAMGQVGGFSSKYVTSSTTPFTLHPSSFTLHPLLYN